MILSSSVSRAIEADRRKEKDIPPFVLPAFFTQRNGSDGSDGDGSGGSGSGSDGGDGGDGGYSSDGGSGGSDGSLSLFKQWLSLR